MKTSVKTTHEHIETHRDERQRELTSVEPRATARGKILRRRLYTATAGLAFSSRR